MGYLDQLVDVVADLVDMFASPGSEACIVCSGVTIFFQSAPSLPISGYIFRTPHRLPHSPMLGYDQITPKFTKRQEKYDAKCLKLIGKTYNNHPMVIES